MKRILPSSTPFIMHVDLVHISSPVTPCTINAPNEQTWECYIFLSHMMPSDTNKKIEIFELYSQINYKGNNFLYIVPVAHCNLQNYFCF